MHVLHLEDSLSDFDLIQEQLKARWPDCTVTRVGARRDYEEAIIRGGFDVILSDYTLPNYNGLAALAFAREHRPEKPFVYISGTIGEERAIEAIKAGASDYIIKDRPKRLIAAIESAFVQLEREAARRRAESKSNEQAKLLDKAREAICAIDAEGRITFWNGGAERHYGWTSNDVMGRELCRMLYSRDPAVFEAARADVLLHGEWHGELRPQTAGGDVPIMDSFWTLVTDDLGVVRAILIVDADITEKKRIELQLMQNQRLEMLGLLTGGIAHDLNNVLGPIITAVEMLLERANSPADDDLLEIVKGSADHGVELVRQLLAFARGDTGVFSELSVDALVGSVLKLLHHVIPSTVQIKASLGNGLWRINGDATQLRQALINLGINARDALPEGGEIEISVENMPIMSSAKCAVGEAKPGRYVCFTVRDNGVGIPPHIVGKLFDAFFTTKRSGKGTGLGLSNIARIVKAHAGFLTVESAMGIGSSFHIHLPASGGGAIAPHSPPALPPVLHAHEHLLLIEDNKALETVFDVTLSMRGFSVSAAATAARGLILLQAQTGSISLAILDLHIPIDECAAVVREMRAIAADLKIVVLSGISPAHQEALAFDPAVVLLPKAVTSEILIGTVTRMLGAGA
jgi:two-component system, cell cycle sensor histidine kinase and response regulator CckA